MRNFELRLVPMSRACVSSQREMDSIQQSKDRFSTDIGRGMEVLMEARSAWERMAYFRQDRERAKRYVFGDQWSDTVVLQDGTTMTEEEYLRQTGQIPLKNNLMRRLIRNVVGLYRSQKKEPVCTARDRDEQQLGETMSTVLQYNRQINHGRELNALNVKEYLIGGLVVNRKSYGWRNDRYDCWTDIVEPDNFFIDNNMRDFRGWDASLCGEVHDVTFGQLCARFAKSPQEYARLDYLYKAARDRSYMVERFYQFGYARPTELDFTLVTDLSKCRVIEVWRKEQRPRYHCHDFNKGTFYKINVEDYPKIEALNNARLQMGLQAGMAREEIPLIQCEWFMDDYWYYYYLTPTGEILEEGDSPYRHGGSPYVWKGYPYIDGEIHSYASDFIDQQRSVNQNMMLMNWMARAAAKGMLLVPEESQSEKMSLEELLVQWGRPDGVGFYKSKDAKGNDIPAPTQVNGNVANVGLETIINLQLKFFEDISGVHGALQGATPTSGTSGSLYNQQTQNATTSLLDVLESFDDFDEEAARIDVHNIQQCYDSRRVVQIAGKRAVYEPDNMEDVQFDLSISESASSPTHRMLANEFLMEIWKAGQITLETMLEVGHFEYADELLQHIRAQQERIANGQSPEAIPEDLRTRIQNGADMAMVNRLHDTLGQSMTAQPVAQQ